MKARGQDPWNQFHIKSGVKNKDRAQNNDNTTARGDENNEQSLMNNSCVFLKCFELNMV